jgi:hypothetical protein
MEGNRKEENPKRCRGKSSWAAEKSPVFPGLIQFLVQPTGIEESRPNGQALFFV